MRNKLLLLAIILMASVGTVRADKWTWTYSATRNADYTWSGNFSPLPVSTWSWGTAYDSTNDYWGPIALTMTGKDANDEDWEASWKMTAKTTSTTKKPGLGVGNGGFYVGGNVSNGNYPTKLTLSTSTFKKQGGKVASVVVNAGLPSSSAASGTISVKVNNVDYTTTDNTYAKLSDGAFDARTFIAPDAGTQQGDIVIEFNTEIGEATSLYLYVVSITINFVEETSDPNEYGIVGELTGGWPTGESATDLPLTLSGGKYIGEVTGFNALKNGYEYKVRANKAWTLQYPSEGNLTWNPSDAEGIGVYTLDFAVTPNPDNMSATTVELTPTKTKDFAIYAVGSDEAETGAAFFSGKWDAATTTNAMTKGEDGLYTISWENVALTAQTYKTKVIAKASAEATEALAWYPSDYNATIAISEAGNYDVTISFDPKTLAVTATATKHKEPYTVTYVNVNDWSTVKAFAWTEGVDTYTAAWPGDDMEATGSQFNGHDVYTITVYAGDLPAQIIFDNGNSGDGNQTADLTFVAGKQYWDFNNDANFIRYDQTSWSSCAIKASTGVYTGVLNGIYWTLGDLSWPAQTLDTSDVSESTAAAWQDPTNLNIYGNGSYFLLGSASEKFCVRTASLTSEEFTKKVKQVTLVAYPYNGEYTLSVYVGNTQIGETQNLSGRAKNTYTFTADEAVAGAVKIYFEQPSTFKAFYLYEIHILLEDGCEEVVVGDGGYATFASDKNLDYSGISGLTAYKATVSGQTVTFASVTTVPAGEGVLLKGTGTYIVPAVLSMGAWAESDNAFKRGTGAAVATANGDGTYNYILNKVEGGMAFVKANGKTVATNRAYLTSTADAARIAINFDGEETTGVSQIVNSKLSDSQYFDLQGRRVSQPTKGLYIVGGKKVIK